VFSSWLRAIKDYLKGFFLYGMLSHLYAEKRCVENLFMLGIFGSTIGFPFLFNYYHLTLLPHYVRHLGPWKKRILKERDFFDQISD
jgi:hypothetical protein